MPHGAKKLQFTGKVVPHYHALNKLHTCYAPSKLHYDKIHLFPASNDENHIILGERGTLW